MECLFRRCHKLKYIDLSSFDTKNVKNMSMMFTECYNLKNIDISSFDLKNVENMYYMFYKCVLLKEIKIDKSSITENLIDIRNIFQYCSNLEKIDLPSFDIKNVEDMSCLFCGCTNLMSINLSSFDTKNVCLFYGCTNLKSINLSSFDTKNVEDMYKIFENCPILEEIKINENSYQKIISENPDVKNKIKIINK